MYCPSCGKETPEQSTFCLHCGERIAAPRALDAHASRMPVEWEYKDFVVEYSGGRVSIGHGGYTIPAALLFCWQSEQTSIAKKLQSWLDEGWQPIGGIGPSCFRYHTYRRWKPDAFTWIVGILTLGFGLLIGLITRLLHLKN